MKATTTVYRMDPKRKECHYRFSRCVLFHFLTERHMTYTERPQQNQNARDNVYNSDLFLTVVDPQSQIAHNVEFKTYCQKKVQCKLWCIYYDLYLYPIICYK